MKASELIRKLTDSVDKHGDLYVHIRCPEDGWETNDFDVHPDPSSELEKIDGIEGTIDINVVGNLRAVDFVRCRQILLDYIDNDLASADPAYVRETLTDVCGCTRQELKELAMLDWLWPDDDEEV